MLTIKVNGKPITISDIMAGVVEKHHDDRYSLKIGFAVDTILTEYERECVGRKLADLAAEHERLKGKLDAVRAECKMRQYGVMDSDFDFGLAQMADVIMAIIDKDGDET
jgi:hypothetical protein